MTNASAKPIILDHPGVLAIVWALCSRAFLGRQVYFCRSREHVAWQRLVLRRVGILGIDFVDQRLSLRGASYDQPGRDFAECVAGWESTEVWQSIPGYVHMSTFAKGILRIAVLQKAAPHYLRAFTLQAWCQRRGECAEVVTSKYWLAQVMRASNDYESTYRVRYVPKFLSLSAFSRAVVVRALKVLRAALSERHSQVSPPLSIPRLNGPKIIVVLNQGLEYGRLFSYSYLLEDSGDGFASWSKAAVIGTGVVRQDGTNKIQPWPFTRLKVSQLVRASATAWRLSVSRQVPAGVCVLLGIEIQRARGISKQLLELWPEFKLAVYAYEAQVPASLTLGIEMCGRTSISTHERLATGATNSVPFAVHTLLAANAADAIRCRHSKSIAVSECIPVGMWRTDLLIEKEQEALAGRSMKPGGTVVILPYHVTDEGCSDLLTTSAECFNDFMSDVLDLAESRPDLKFIVRGKTDEWTTMSKCKEVHVRLTRTPNVQIDSDYSQLNRSYALCSIADLVIAKHNSLVDECLSVGIPCLLHDYNRYYSSYASEVLSYIPKDLWVHNFSDLKSKVEEWVPLDAASRKGQQKSDRSLSDGRVRERIRKLIAARI